MVRIRIHSRKWDPVGYWGFSRVYSNSCCSCLFEPKIIKIGHSSHEIYSNRILNFQESTTILNACTKKSGNLLNAPQISKLTHIHKYPNWHIYTNIQTDTYTQISKQTHIHKYPNWHIYTNIQTDTYTQISKLTHIHKYPNWHIYTNIQTDTYTQIFKLTHIHKYPNWHIYTNIQTDTYTQISKLTHIHKYPNWHIYTNI